MKFWLSEYHFLEKNNFKHSTLVVLMGNPKASFLSLLSSSRDRATLIPCSLILYHLVNGGFGAWNEWTTCSQTCGGGTQQRSRDCNNPSPSFGGDDCVGEASGVQLCNTQLCPSKFCFTLQIILTNQKSVSYQYYSTYNIFYPRRDSTQSSMPMWPRKAFNNVNHVNFLTKV